MPRKNKFPVIVILGGFEDVKDVKGWKYLTKKIKQQLNI